MTYKQIEASRELRLWIGQVIVPAVTMAVCARIHPGGQKYGIKKAGRVKVEIQSRGKG